MKQDAEQWLVSRLAHRLNRRKAFLDLDFGAKLSLCRIFLTLYLLIGKK